MAECSCRRCDNPIERPDPDGKNRCNTCQNCGCNPPDGYGAPQCWPTWEERMAKQRAEWQMDWSEIGNAGDGDGWYHLWTLNVNKTKPMAYLEIGPDGEAVTLDRQQVKRLIKALRRSLKAMPEGARKTGDEE